MSVFVFELNERHFSRLKKLFRNEKLVCPDCQKPLRFGEEVVSVRKRSSEGSRTYYHVECWKRKFL